MKNLHFECPNCQTPILPNRNLLDQYLNQGHSICPNNHCTFSLFSELSKIISAMKPMGFAYDLISSDIRAVKEKVRNGIHHFAPPIDENEELLWVNYTPHNSKIHFAELRGNTPDIFKYENCKQINLLINNCEEGELNIAIWVVDKTYMTLWHHLSKEACLMFTRSDTSLLAVAANSACEHITYEALDNLLKSKDFGNDQRKRFLQDAVTYSHQLKSLVKICFENQIPNEVLESLLNLRTARNEIAHGKKISSRTDIEMAQWLVSMVMLKRFFEISHPL